MPPNRPDAGRVPHEGPDREFVGSRPGLPERVRRGRGHDTIRDDCFDRALHP